MRALLLAGGGGTRLWPLSSEDRPKQFLPLLSSRSLLAETYERLLPLTEEVYVATTDRYAQLLRAELGSLPADRLLLEPARRNSGPAILSAALRFVEEGDPVTAALPSDQTVSDGEGFRRSLLAAGRLSDKASVVVLAVRPTRPETDFGYLEVAEGSQEEGFSVSRFSEKPGGEEARGFLASGRHFWNAGIFVFRPSRFLAEARRVAGALLEEVERYRERLRARDAEGARRAYEQLPSISIDYAVMEKAQGVKAVPLSSGWSDVGTWRAVRDLRGASDENGNLIISPVPVLAPGVRETAIIVGGEGVLVLPFEQEGELRAAVERLKEGEQLGGNRVKV